MVNNILDSCTDYVMCATLNQIVNYIPLVMISEVKKGNSLPNLYSIQYKQEGGGENDERFDQKKWVDNLKSVIKDIEIVEVSKNCIKDQIRTLKRLIPNEEEGKVVVWNLTGGQRYLAFVILNLIQKDDKNTHYVIYLEGNTGKIVFGKKGKEEKEEKNITYTLQEERYGIDNLSLKEVVSLAGFEIKADEKNLINVLKGEYFGNREKAIYSKVLEELKKGEKTFEAILKNNRQKKDRLELLLESLSLDGNEKELLGEKLKGKEYPAGYLLEYIAICEIQSVIEEYKDFFVGLYHSVKPYADKTVDIKRLQFCEFDILLLTKTGQVIIFECKSGGMTGENAKARKYATYAVAGVYGTPILITPFLDTQLNKIAELKGEKYSSLDAVKSAKRNNLRVWALDKIKDNLEDLLYDMELQKIRLLGGNSNETK